MRAVRDPSRAGSVGVSAWLVVAGVVALAGCGRSEGASSAPSRAQPTRSTSATSPTPASTAMVTTSIPGSTVSTTAAPSTTTTPPAPTTAAPAIDAPQEGPYDVIAVDRTWTDPARPTAPGSRRPTSAGRTIPVRIYVPSQGGRPLPGPFPLFVWSHGLDATVDYFDPYLRAWAARGYVVAAPTFPLTHAGVPGGTVYRDYVNQPDDVRFVIDQLLGLYGRSGSLRAGVVDEGRIGVGGHSLGAITSLALGGSPCCTDARIRSVVSVDGQRPILPGGAGRAQVPVLLIHGDRDTTFPVSESRAILADAVGPRFLIVLRGVPHTPFRLTRPAAVISATVGDFLDLTLKGRTAAAADLERDGRVPGLSDVVS